MPTVHGEVETKYDADDSFEVPGLVELFDALRGRKGLPAADGSPWTEDATEQLLSATYYDTVDLDLLAAGLTLRRRTGGEDAGWHLKVPVAHGARTELRTPLDDGDVVPNELRAATYARTGPHDVVPVASIETVRTRRRLVDSTGRVLVEIADDKVSARRPVRSTSGPKSSVATSWREIEVELVDGPRALIDAIDPVLRARGLTPAVPTSKLERALGPDALTRSGTPSASRRRSRKAVSAGAVVLDQIGAQVEQIRTQDPLVRLDASGAVHAMRVASRRLRSALTTFKPLFRSEAVRPVRSELKWLAGVLGAARDAEVMRDRVSRAVHLENEEVRLRSAVADLVDDELDDAYRTARDEVMAQLSSDRYRDLLDALTDLVARPPFTGRASRPAAKVLPGLVARGYRDVRSAMKAANRASGAEREARLHDARKAAKRARYAGEAVTPVFGKDARAFAEAMEDMQEALGEHLDSTNTRALLLELAAETPLPSTAFTYGRLHAIEDLHAAQSGTTADDAWSRARQKRLRRWLR